MGAHLACTRAETGFFTSCSFIRPLFWVRRQELNVCIFLGLCVPTEERLNVKVSSFAHQTQARLKDSLGLDLKRSHIYELMAAAVGQGSYAALTAQGLLGLLPSDPLAKHYGVVDKDQCAVRATMLGYSKEQSRLLAAALCSEMASHRLGCLPFDDILDALLSGSRQLYREETHDDAYFEALEAAYEAGDSAWPDDPEPLRLDSPWMINALRTSAARGDGHAHLALGLLFDARTRANSDNFFEDGADFDESDDVPDSRAGLYWYERQQKGETLTGVELEWAQAYADRVQRRHLAAHDRVLHFASARDHFNAAAELGQHDALLLLADRYGDDRFFDLENPQVRADPLWIADVAESVGRYEWAPAWVTLAAERGNIRAMRELIEHHHQGDALKTWTWFYLAKLLGTDLTQDNYRAIHEDGSSYDDDVGGPMFAVGEDGVSLPPADESIKNQAQIVARALHTQIQQR